MTSAARHRPGFTLIEVLVALALMALLAGMGWQGLSGLLRAREQTTARVDASARVYTALAQWRADLDAMQVIPHIDPGGVRWDGRVLRWVRRSVLTTPMGAEGDLQVVAWRLENGLWRRWLSAPAKSPTELRQAWQMALNPPPNDTTGSAQWAVLPLQSWRLVYFRDNAWTHPLSSDGQTPPMPSRPGGIPLPTSAPPVGAQPHTAPNAQPNTPPDAIRLILEFGPDSPYSGPLTGDWIRPELTPTRS